MGPGRFDFWRHEFIDLGLNRGRGRLLNFPNALPPLKRNQIFLVFKAELGWLDNVSGLFLSTITYKKVEHN